MRPHDWKPNSSDRERLLAFEGYGPDTPDVIFVGLEEYCDPDPEKQRDAIWLRCTSSAYASKRVDKDQALAALAGLVKTEVPVWKMMATIMSGLTGASEEDELHALGSRPPRGSLGSWLTELRALPRPGTKAFKGTYIDEWFKAEFPSAKAYDASSCCCVSRLVAALDVDPAPKYVFFYGLRPGSGRVRPGCAAISCAPSAYGEVAARGHPPNVLALSRGCEWEARSADRLHSNSGETGAVDAHDAPGN